MGTGTPYYLKLSWNAPSLGDPATASFAGKLYPEVAGYNNAAMVEMNIVYWPKKDATANSFKNATLLFAPNKSNSKNPIAVTCPGGTYSCSTTDVSKAIKGFSIATAVDIAGFDPSLYNYAIRITPRYKGTHFAFTAYGTDGSAVAPAQSNKAQIDVTAKVGNLYRRVKAEKIILPCAIETIGTSVLYAGRGSNDNASCGITKAAVVDSITYSIVLGSIGPNCD